MLDSFILFILSILTIRQLIAQNFDIPLSPKWRWIIYDTKTYSTPILCRRAYNTRYMISCEQSNSSIIEKLLKLGSRHIKYYEDGLGHGRSTRIQSKYFINTLEASYNNHDLAIMTTALRTLIGSSNLPFPQIDFILYIKSGNQILARNIYREIGEDMIYICRRDKHSSSYPLSPNAEIHMHSVQFENLDSLLEAAKHSDGRNLCGIAVDCSISTGEGLNEAIQHFNELITKESLNIDKIEHAFVLYAHKEFSDKDCKEFTLHRYFDMNENTRELIYKMHQGIDNIGSVEIYNYLDQENLLRV